MRKATSLIILMLAWSLTALAQTAIPFTSDEGLSSSCVRRIYEDSRHNVWICTRNGLNRYDGAKLVTYHHDENDPKSLQHDIVTYILEMDKDNIIVGSENGLQAYNYATNSFTSIPILGESNDTVRTHIVSMHKFLNGEIHVCATSRGSFVVRKKDNGELVAEYTDKYSHQDHRPGFLLNSKEGEVWSINNNDSKVILFTNGKATVFDEIANVNRICEGMNGSIYASTANEGVYRYDKKQKAFRKLVVQGLDDNMVVKSIRGNGKGQVMICTDGNGLKIYDEKTGIVTQSDVRAADFDLRNSNVEDAMLDSDGNLWVGVYWKGVYVMPRVSSTFEYVGRRSPVRNTIGTSCVTSICPARDGGVWVAADHEGLYHVSADGKESKHWSPNIVAGVPETIGDMYEDESGTLWLGSSIGGMVCMDVKSETFTPFANVAKGGEKVQKIFNINVDDNQCLWIGCMGNGVFRYDPRERKLDRFSYDTGQQNGDMRNPWVASVKAYGKRLYVGHADGLDVFNIKDDGTLERVMDVFHSTLINDIKVADDGTVWMATSKGVATLDVNGNQKIINVSDGLSDNHVGTIELVKKGKRLTVWASTDNGLCRIDPASGTINNFFIGDGLQGNEFCDRASGQRDGILYFGGINGMNYFNPNKIDQAYSMRTVDFRIVDLYLFGEPVYVGRKSGSYDILTDWISEAEEINLCHSDNTFSLELSAMNLLASHTSYEYSINNGEWISAGEGQNRIAFTNMDPGTYDIRIRTAGYSQQSSEKGIRIVVHPAWYDSTWAHIIYILLLLAIAYFVYQQVKERMAARRVLMKHRQEEELNEARIQFFMNISHEIRTPMTLILAPLEKLRKMDADEEHQRNYNLIYQNAHRILRLINQLMDVRKIEKGQFKLEYQRINLVGFLKNLYDVYETSAKNRGIEFVFEHDGLERLEAMVDTSSFDKIVMNLLSNAFKFTPDGGKITLGLKKEEDNDFTVTVTDSGVGIPDTEKQKVFERFYSAKHQNGYIGTGIGLNLTALLVDLHKGEITVKDNPEGQGTRFAVTMPMEAKAEQMKLHIQETDVNAQTKEEVVDDSHADVQAEALPMNKTTIRNRNLLVVEDDTAIRQYIHSELSGDFKIHECSNGMEGWEYVQKNPDKVDLIVSDIMMPVMEGTTLCQNVKNNFNTNHIPVILMSAKTTEADRIAGMSIGADAYVTKPFNVELLRTTALSILQQRQLLKGKFNSEKQQEEKIDKIELTSPDEHLMERVMKTINGNLDNPELSVEFVADKVGLSRVHFHRKIKELTGQTPRDFIKAIRLKEAARLLSEKHLDITDVSIATGFKSLSTFSTSFKQVYGMTPSEYMKEKMQ